MGFNCGIVGLPNVGKSTLFNALTKGHVPAENYPFCTTDHNTGIAIVPDKRLTDIAAIFKPQRVVPAVIEFIDIAGLVKNAHSGEGLGNTFLGHIRNVDAIAHVLRCFEDSDVVHQYGDLDPARDAEIVNTELMLADLAIIEKKIEKLEHLIKTGNKEMSLILDICHKIRASLTQGKPANETNLTEKEKFLVADLSLLTLKPMFYILNSGDSTDSPLVKKVAEYLSAHSAEYVIISGKLEAELSELSDQERTEFLTSLGRTHPAIEDIVITGYRLLDLITFFTKDGSEVRAWTIKRGTTAPQAAGKIHSDFENKFIRAEVYNYDDLMRSKDEHQLRSSGKIRIEGHNYIVKDGDIIHIRAG